MTVRELIIALLDYPAESLVILQKDAEGNGYSPATEVNEGHYEPDSTWSGEIYPCGKDKGDAAVIVPVN